MLFLNGFNRFQGKSFGYSFSPILRKHHGRTEVDALKSGMDRSKVEQLLFGNIFLKKLIHQDGGCRDQKNPDCRSVLIFIF